MPTTTTCAPSAMVLVRDRRNWPKVKTPISTSSQNFTTREITCRRTHHTTWRDTTAVRLSDHVRLRYPIAETRSIQPACFHAFAEVHVLVAQHESHPAFSANPISPPHLSPSAAGPLRTVSVPASPRRIGRLQYSHTHSPVHTSLLCRNGVSLLPTVSLHSSTPTRCVRLPSLRPGVRFCVCSQSGQAA